MSILKQYKTFTDTFPQLYPELQKRFDDNLFTKTVTFVVTQKCPLRCTYCYQHGKDDQTMTKETAKKAVDMLFKEYDKHGYVNKDNAKAIILDFIGGEPFEAIEIMDYITEYFKYKTVILNHPWAMNYMISVSTNGIYYNTPKVQDYINRNKGRLSISITIDGNKELHDSCRIFPDGRGSYDIVEKAIKTQLKQFGEVGTKLTIAPANVKYLSDAILNLKNLGLNYVHANCIYEEGWNIEHAKIYYSELKKLADYIIDNDLYSEFGTSLFDDFIGKPQGDEDNKNWCGGTGSMLAFDVHGDIYPCVRYIPFCLSNNREPYIIGNAKKGIGKTQEHNEKIQCLNCITRKSQSTEECYNCPISSGCGWCSAFNYDYNGTPDQRVAFICDMHKARVMATSYFYNKLYRKLEDNKRFDLNIPKEWALEIIDENEFNMLKELSRG